MGLTWDYLVGDAREMLKQIPDESIQCMVTSPPYWGLRDYDIPKTTWADGWKGTLGSEPTIQMYLDHMREIFKEIHRVLRKDGVIFVNVGDTYFSGSRRATSYDTSYTIPEDSPTNDRLYENLCGACLKAYLIGISHNGVPHVPTPVLSPYESNLSNKVIANVRAPTSDSSRQADHNEVSIQDLLQRQGLSSEQPLSTQESTIDESSRQQRDRYLPLDNSSVCLWCEKTLKHDVRGSSHTQDYTSDTETTLKTSTHRTSDKVSSDLAYQCLSNTPLYNLRLKPKDLMGIPWRLAFSLQDDGWWLRSNIIWHKTNPNPENAPDRPSRDHEDIFLLTKSMKYYYNGEAIAEPQKPESIARYNRSMTGSTPGSAYQNEKREKPHNWNIDQTKGRSARTVWVMSTGSYSGAHYATFPPELPERCIKAGSREGDMILDPFAGSGTTLMVARQLGRSAIGIDIKAEYREQAEKRANLNIKDIEGWAEKPAGNSSRDYEEE